MPRTSPHAGPGPARTSSSSSCGAPHGATAAIGMGSAGSGADGQRIAGPQPRGTDRGEHIGRARPQHGRAGEPAAHGEVRTCTVGIPLQVQLRPGGPRVRLVRVDLVSGEADRTPGTGHREPQVAECDRAEPAHRGFDDSSGLGIADQPVRGARGAAVEGAGCCDAERCRTRPPQVLQSREESRLDDSQAGVRIRQPRLRTVLARCRGRGAVDRRGRGRSEAHAGSRCQERRGGGIRVEQRSIGGADESPPAGRIARIGAGESRREPDRPAGHTGARDREPGHIEGPVRG